MSSYTIVDIDAIDPETNRAFRMEVRGVAEPSGALSLLVFDTGCVAADDAVQRELIDHLQDLGYRLVDVWREEIGPDIVNLLLATFADDGRPPGSWCTSMPVIRVGGRLVPDPDWLADG